MSTDLPGWLEQLHARHPRPASVAPDTPRHPVVEPGQIRRLLPMDPGAPAALVLVTDSDHEREAHTVALVTPDTEFGGDRDLLLSTSETGLAYDVLVQVELKSYAWTVQLDAVISQVDKAWLDTVHQLCEDEPGPIVPDLRAGSAIVSRNDPRWSFKVAELDRLNELTGECSRQLVDDVTVTVADLDSLTPADSTDPVDTAETAAFVYQLIEHVLNGHVVLPAWAVSELLESGLAESYHAAGLDEAYQALLSLAQTFLVTVSDEHVPDVPAGSGSVHEWTMRVLLEQQRRSGCSSVHVYCRADKDVTAGPARMWTGWSHVQSIRTPCDA